MASVIAFDVNETLLDLSALDGAFQDLFGDAAYRPQWFAQMLQLAFVGGLTGEYVDFTTAQHAALRMLADRTGTTVSDDDARAIVDAMSSLPPHPEVREALTRLRHSALTVIALTNSVLSVAEAQLQHAGLRYLFDAVISADTVGRLKPAPEPYRAVAEHFGVPTAEMRLVAAHAWDVSGHWLPDAGRPWCSGRVWSPARSAPSPISPARTSPTSSTRSSLSTSGDSARDQ